MEGEAMAGVDMDDVHAETMDVAGGVAELDRKIEALERRLRRMEGWEDVSAKQA